MKIQYGKAVNENDMKEQVTWGKGNQASGHSRHSSGQRGRRGKEASDGENAMRQQGNEANEEQPVTRHRGTKAVEEEQATQDEARGLKRPNWWNPLRRWLNELPTPDFNLKIKLYEK